MTTEYLVETPVGEVTVVEPLGAREAFPPGAEVALRFREAGLFLLPAPDPGDARA